MIYFDTQIEYEYQAMNEFIENEMHKLREKVVGKLSTLFAHPNFFQEDVILTLAYGYFDSYEPSTRLANTLNLGKLDFLSVMNDFDAFKEEYLKNYEEAQNF